MEEIVSIPSEDSHKEEKKNLYLGATRIIDLRNSIKRDQENLLLSIGTLFVGIFLSVYLRTFLSYMFFGVSLLCFLIYAIWKNNRDIQSLHNDYGKLVKEGDKYKINLRSKFYS